MTKTRNLHFALAGALVIAGLTLTTNARAAGFAVAENSAKGLGRAFAGAAAVADDASTVFFNPAGMTYLDGINAMGAFHLILPNSEFTNNGSTVSPLLGGAPLTGGAKTSASNPLTVPNLFASYQMNDRLWVGMGLNAPFGLETEYGAGWVGRYQALRSELITINFNPAVAYRVTDWLSVGAGASVQYAEAELSNAIDFGSVCLGSGVAPATCAGAGLTPQAADGSANVEGNDTSFGYNLGLIVEPVANTRLGLHYRSKISHELEGVASFNVPAAAAFLTAGGNFQGSTARAKATMPETAAISVVHQYSDKISVMADATWTHWSRFETLTVQIDNAASQEIVQPEDWDNTWRYSAGVEYDSLEQWALRAGVAWDESPVKTGFRTPRIPDADRWWGSVGGSWRWSDLLTIDAGFTHIAVSDAPVNQTGSTGDVLRGAFKNTTIQILSLQGNVKF
ncbi:MAG: outer membrane protein transport protein [Alphaproteobacteria bacterium]